MAEKTQGPREQGSGNGRGQHPHRAEDRMDTEERSPPGRQMGARGEERREGGRFFKDAQDRSNWSHRQDSMLGMGYASAPDRGPSRDRGRVYEDDDRRWQPRRDVREVRHYEQEPARFEGGPDWRRQGMGDFGVPSQSQGRELREPYSDRDFGGREGQYAGRSGYSYRPAEGLMRPDTSPSSFTPPEEEWERAHHGYRDRAESGRKGMWDRESCEVCEVMTPNPAAVHADTNLKEVARVMHDADTGIVPVIDEQRRLLGVITDRDMVMRTFREDRPWTAVRASEVMTDEVHAATPDDKVRHIIDLMGKKQVRRIPVVDRQDRLVGMISTADVALRADRDEELQHALERISKRRSFWSRLWH
jgi:CBS domain-containing protein